MSGFLVWGIPPLAFGHGSEYIFAKLTISPNPRQVALELSVEYLENPLLDSVEDARKALSSDILIETASGRFSLNYLADQVTWSERNSFDESSPAPVPDSEEGAQHKLLVARVDLSNLKEKSLNLRISEKGEQAVIFWVDEPVPGTEPDSEPAPLRWVILIAGDTSMAVELPPTLSPNLILWIPVSVGVVALGMLMAIKSRT